MPFIGNVGTGELILIALVLLLFFGSKKLSELAKGLGQSSKEIKNVKKEWEKAIAEETDMTEEKPEEKLEKGKQKEQNKTEGGA